MNANSKHYLFNVLLISAALQCTMDMSKHWSLSSCIELLSYLTVGACYYFAHYSEKGK